jgi:undecaprenyl-diphosphatase
MNLNGPLRVEAAEVLGMTVSAPKDKQAMMRIWRPNLGRGEYLTLGIVVLISGLVLGFVQIAEAVVEGETLKFDNAVLLMFRVPGHPETLLGPLWLQEMGRDITSLGSFAVLGLIVIGVVGYLLMANKRATALLILISVLGGTAISTVLKMGFDRPRPDINATARVFTASFPSGHSMLSAVTYLTLGALLARLVQQRRMKVYFLCAAIVLTGLVGISRLYLGVHYPTDVLAGWCVGAAWALLCTTIADWLQQRRAVEPVQH